MVEYIYIVFYRKVGKRKAASKPEKSSAPKTTKKDKKAKKDPNKPKRPPSAFFVFLFVSLCLPFLLYTLLENYLTYLSFFRSEDFRKTFKAENPNVKAVSAVSVHSNCAVVYLDDSFYNMHLKNLLCILIEGWKSWRREMEIFD
jgi:hypothetical protein